MATSPAKRPLVLVVDDDDDFRTELAGALASRGYRVWAAGDGKQALACLESSERPSVVLLDLSMPRMDGWQLRYALTERDALQGVPIVVMTGAQSQKAEQLDVAEVLEKPFSIDHVVTVIERHC